MNYKENSRREVNKRFTSENRYISRNHKQRSNLFHINPIASSTLKIKNQTEQNITINKDSLDIHNQDYIDNRTHQRIPETELGITANKNGDLYDINKEDNYETSMLYDLIL
jgi:hypothetical protein